MANYSYIGYDPGSVVFGGGTISLSGTFDPDVNRRVFDVTDDAGGTVLGGTPDTGTVFDGDSLNNEGGDDLTQVGDATSLDGTTVFASGNMYLEQSYTLNKPGGGTIDMYRVEVDGSLVGYIVSEPLEAGVNYTFSTANVTPTNAPDTSDLNSIIDVPCFMRGTRILTDKHEVPVEELRVGDLLCTASNGLQRIRWIGQTLVPSPILKALPNLRPIKISKCSLGEGLPLRDLLVSRQHRIMMSSKIVQRMFDRDSVLVAANKLIGLPGIKVDDAIQNVEYYHLLLEHHEVIYAEGAPTESLYTGPGALQAVGAKAREQLFELFPELAKDTYEPKPALPLPTGKQQKQLVERHAKNQKPPLQWLQPTTALEGQGKSSRQPDRVRAKAG